MEFHGLNLTKEQKRRIREKLPGSIHIVNIFLDRHLGSVSTYKMVGYTHFNAKGELTIYHYELVISHERDYENHPYVELKSKETITDPEVKKEREEFKKRRHSIAD